MLKVNKHAGITINDFIKTIKKERGYKKLCFCGRLDPMARGELLLLYNENCKKMPQYLKKDKTYQFKIVLGIQTDSDDSLGLIQNYKTDYNVEKVITKITKKIHDCPNKFNQRFHIFSSKCVNGKPLWEYSRDGIILKDYPEHPVEIKQKKIMGLTKKSFIDFKNEICKRINKIDKKHNFRQTEILKKWNELKINNLYYLTIELTVSSGFYIRQFVRDLSEKINFPLLTYDIYRKNIIL